MGNSVRPRTGHFLSVVHPHACGELVVERDLIESLTGSSPRMWGTRHRRSQHSPRRWFIPTHVGNSSAPSPLKNRIKVHPHACGELPIMNELSLPTTGSSPRMWGTHLLHRAHDCCQWFIPTHVGNSTSVYCTCRAHPVHPHACGELTSIRKRHL